MIELNSGAICERARSGDRISIEEALHLHANATTEDLASTAHAIRLAKTDGEVVTYLVDRNINYTNVCTTDCKFCEFYRPLGHVESYVLDRETLGRKIRETIDAGGTRILLQGGHHPELRIDWYVDMLRWIKSEFVDIELNAFSPSEIRNIADTEGMDIRTVLCTLRDAGMDGLPGGGGEILDDEIRQRVSPKKQKTEDWLHCMKVAHSLGMVTSASQVIGFGEGPEHRLNALDAIRRTQDESLAKYDNGFLSFVMWPLQHESRFGAVFGDRLGHELGADREQYLRHVALCRIFLDNVLHVGASWPTMGPDIAKEALVFGADDFGSTMMEENVVSSAGSTHTCMTEPLIRNFIAEAGFRPMKRDSEYNHLATC